MKSSRNKTIDISISEGKQYLDNCIKFSSKIKSKFEINDILNKTIQGDALQVLPLMPDSFIDLIIADPPYNLDKNYNGHTFKKISDSDYIEYTENWIKLIKPLLKPNGSIYVCCDWKCSSAIESVLRKYFIIQNRITWQREKGRGAMRNWKNNMEDIWFATVSNKYTFNINDVKQKRKVLAPYKHNGKPKDWVETDDGKFRLTFPSNFWDDISVPYWSMKENTAHPTQKPEKLIAKLVLASSNVNDIVFDPFLGSGTTSVIAKKLNRKYIGIEQNKQYCIWAEKRLEMADSDPSIQGYTDGVFWERNTHSFQKNL
ncbi:MAG: site-specific DNA-methyltransferase [Bacteroidetes bacterium]|nr:site-specific DNA-methyltransferase [Bacteroidota bacterium]